MDQYTFDTSSSAKPVVVTPEQKKIENLEHTIKDLNARIDSQYKVIDKLARDVRKLKDQLNDVAVRVSRG